MPYYKEDFPYIDDFCDDEIYVISTLGQGPKGDKGDQGDKGDDGDVPVGFIEQTVSDWLIEHPEATMAQDRSITKNKLADDVIEELNEIKARFNVGPNTPIYFASFFDDNTTPECYAFVSTNGNDFSRISANPLFTGRDSSVWYEDGVFYIAVTDYRIPNWHFTVYKSVDLITWEAHKISLRGLPNTESMSACWAPEWFDNEDELYIVLSVLYNDNQNSETYLVKVNNLKTLEFGTPRRLNLSGGSRGFIDTCIIKHENAYYAFSKKVQEDNMPDGKIWEFVSPDLENWTLYSEDLFPTNSSRAEAPTICQFNNRFYLYVDCYKYSGGNHVPNYTHYATSTDLINWSSLNPVDSSFPTRHGGVLKINDDIGCDIIRKFISNNSSHVTASYAKEVNSQTNSHQIAIGDKNLWRDSFASTETKNGITMQNVNGEISISGTLDGSQVFFEDHYAFYLPAGTYVLSGCPDGGGSDTYEMFIDANGVFYNDYGNGAVVNIANDSEAKIKIRIKQSIGTSLTFKPMIRQANLNDDYALPNAMTRHYVLPNTEVIPTSAIKVITANGMLFCSGQFRPQNVASSGWKRLANFGIANNSGATNYGFCVSEGTTPIARPLRMTTNSDTLEAYLSTTDNDKVFNIMFVVPYSFNL